MTSDGIGPTWPEPKMLLYVSFRIGMGAVALIHMAIPCATLSMPNVTRKEGMPKRVTRKPFIEPTISPTSRPATMPARIPYCWIAMAVTTEARPASAPIDRSISAAAITKVTATAITEMIAVWRIILSKLLGFRKPEPLNTMLKNNKRTRKPMYTTYCRQSKRAMRAILLSALVLSVPGGDTGALVDMMQLLF